MFENLFSLSNLVGFIALVFIFLTFFSDKRKTILSVQTLGIVLLGIHLYLLGEKTVIFFSLLMAMRNILFVFVEEQSHQNGILVLWLFFYTLVLIWGWESWVSLLPFLGSAFGTLAFWFASTKHIRCCILFSIMPWIIYALIINSFPTLLVELVMLSSVLINIVRFDILKAGEK